MASSASPFGSVFFAREEDDSASSLAADPEAAPSSESGFFSFNWASKPSTRFSRASSTSVLGPLFFGTASSHRVLLVSRAARCLHIWSSGPRTRQRTPRIVCRPGIQLQGAKGNERTIYAWALENRTSLAGRAESIALNLHDKPTKSENFQHTHEHAMPSVSQDTSFSLPRCNSVPCACDMICSSWTLEARCSYGESAIARYRPADETWRLTSW